MQKNKKPTPAKRLNIRESAPFHKSLSDVALYSLGGLCAVSLLQLFGEDDQSEFNRTTLEKILNDLGQPKQTNESMLAILDGEVMDSTDAFVDSLMGEECLKETRQPIIVDLIILSIGEGCYDARMRVLIKHIAWLLRVSWDRVEEIEEELAESLEYNKYIMSDDEEKEKAKQCRNRKIKRYALIGLATVGGGALIGLTGGLAAPLVAAGAGAVIGGAGAAALGSAAGVAIIGSLFGVAGAGLTGYKMKRRVGAVEEFAFEPLTLIGSKYDFSRSVNQLHITIAVTGWINDQVNDFRLPWKYLAESQEQYSLRWESKYLKQLGEAFDLILQTGLSMATTEALKYTILSGLISAIAWPAALISAAGAIDNPWHVCTQRAVEAGKQLAEVLLAREQGNRPITLIGFSLGARVIFCCLEELVKRKGSEGIVEDVILLGAPVSGDPKNWQKFSKVVAGKIVNGYSRGDWLLKFLFRTASVTLKVAGLQPVKWDNRRMHNIDLTDVIDGHGDYIKNLEMILKAVGVRTRDEFRRTDMKSSSDQHIKLSHSRDSGLSETPDSASGGEAVIVESKGDVSGTQDGIGKKGEAHGESDKEEGKVEVQGEVKDPDVAIKGEVPVVGSSGKLVPNTKDCDEQSQGKVTDDHVETVPEQTAEGVESHKEKAGNEAVPMRYRLKDTVKDKFDKFAGQHLKSKGDEKAKQDGKAVAVAESKKDEVDHLQVAHDEGNPSSESCYFTDSDPCSEEEEEEEKQDL